MILSKHFLITFLKNTMRLPSFSSCFSRHELSFSDEEFDSTHVALVVAAILKLSALLFLDPVALYTGNIATKWREE